MAARADDRSYALAVEQAHSLVKEGLGGRPDAAAKARDVLLAGTGQTQPEILSDLDQNPPNYADADKRLGAVAAALGRPGDVDNPAQARATLHGILAQDRYHGLRAGQSLWDRFWNWVFTQLFGWLAGLNLVGLPVWFWFTLLGIGAAVAALVAGLIVRTGWTRAGRALGAGAESTPLAHATDRFAASMGIAKPTPLSFPLPPTLRIWALMPITRPRASKRGPPELPWVISASVWIASTTLYLFTVIASIDRWIAETTPTASEFSFPSGLPIAATG